MRIGIVESHQCEVQGKLFELAVKKGYEGGAFIEAFMKSDVAKRLDSDFDHLQWAGEEYNLEQLNDEVGGLKKGYNGYHEEIMYWAGYIYRYWHYYKGLSSKEIYLIADEKIMKDMWLGFHTLDVEMAIDDLSAL